MTSLPETPTPRDLLGLELSPPEPNPRGPLGLELSHSEPTPNASPLIDYSLAEPEILIARTTQDFPLIVNFPQLSLEFSPFAMLTDSLLSLSTILSSEFC